MATDIVKRLEAAVTDMFNYQREFHKKFKGILDEDCLKEFDFFNTCLNLLNIPEDKKNYILTAAFYVLSETADEFIQACYSYLLELEKERK